MEIVSAKNGSLLDSNWQRFQSFLLRMGTEDFPQPQENRTKRPPLAVKIPAQQLHIPGNPISCDCPIKQVC